MPIKALIRSLAICLHAAVALSTAHAAETRASSEADLINFAFARYLGTGFYTTGDSRVFVLQIPLTHTLREIDLERRESGYMLRLPLTIGLVDFENIVDGEIPDIEDVGTISLVPGVEYLYPVKSNWSLQPFIDLGLAHDLHNDINVRVFGVGMKSFAWFGHGNNTLLLGNRLLYASENTIDIDGSSDFAVFETGLDYHIPTEMSVLGHFFNVSLYYVNHYYLNDLVFVRILNNPIQLSSSNEFGFTFSLPQVSWLPDDPRLGFGVQISGDIRVYRVVFGMPFF